MVAAVFDMLARRTKRMTTMRYLCLIYLDEKQLAAMPEAEMSALNARHLAYNEELLDSGHFAVEDSLEEISAHIKRYYDERVGGRASTGTVAQVVSAR